jgi:hypothetical protein
VRGDAYVSLHLNFDIVGDTGPLILGDTMSERHAWQY